jgi:hypothetical protein
MDLAFVDQPDGDNAGGNDFVRAVNVAVKKFIKRVGCMEIGNLTGKVLFIADVDMEDQLTVR